MLKTGIRLFSNKIWQMYFFIKKCLCGFWVSSSRLKVAEHIGLKDDKKYKTLQFTGINNFFKKSAVMTLNNAYYTHTSI